MSQAEYDAIESNSSVRTTLTTSPRNRIPTIHGGGGAVEQDRKREIVEPGPLRHSPGSYEVASPLRKEYPGNV